MINGGEGPWQVEKNLVIQATSSQPTCNFIVAIVGSFCVCFQHSTTSAGGISKAKGISFISIGWKCWEWEKDKFPRGNTQPLRNGN